MVLKVMKGLLVYISCSTLLEVAHFFFCEQNKAIIFFCFTINTIAQILSKHASQLFEIVIVLFGHCKSVV